MVEILTAPSTELGAVFTFLQIIQEVVIVSSSSPNGNESVPLSPFDPARLRLAQVAGPTVQRLLTTVPVRKPAREWFVRTHHDDGYRLVTMLLESKDERDWYLIEPALLDELQGEPCVVARLLVTSTTRQHRLFLWPVKLPDDSNKLDSWNRSALEAAEMARERWVRVNANMHSSSYEMLTAMGEIPPPVWPTLTFEQILQTAFKNYYIGDYNHPILRKLRGEW